MAYRGQPKGRPAGREPHPAYTRTRKLVASVTETILPFPGEGAQQTIEGSTAATTHGATGRMAVVVGSGAEGLASPSGNTGAQTAEKPWRSVAGIDWLSVTFPAELGLELILDTFGGEGWVPMERGARGYPKGFIRGGIMVLWGARPEMGIHVSASGEGCRNLEAIGRISDEEEGPSHTWQTFLALVMMLGGRLSRLDVAMDDREGLIEPATLEEATRKRLLVTRFKQVDVRMGTIDPSTGEQREGHTVYFGNRTSDCMVRVYDKGAEQRAKGRLVDGHWCRVEMELKQERAQGMALAIVECGFAAVPKVLKSYMDFKQQGTHSQRERWQTCEWWAEFLATMEKLQLSVDPVYRTLERSFEWIRAQVAPTLSMMLQAWGGDLGPLMELIRAGSTRLQPWQKALLLLGGSRADEIGTYDPAVSQMLPTGVLLRQLGEMGYSPEDYARRGKLMRAWGTVEEAEWSEPMLQAELEATKARLAATKKERRKRLGAMCSVQGV